MSTAAQPFPILTNLSAIQHKWGWLLALGIAQVVLGTIAIAAACLTTVVSVFVFGWLLLIGGAVSIAGAFWEKEWSGFFIDLVVGILYAVAGMMMVSNPVEAAATLTLLIAMFLILGGAFRIGLALFNRFEHRWWLLLNGVVTLALGIIILNGWPETAYWVIGLFVGIEMIFYGWSLVMLGLAAKNLPDLDIKTGA